MLKHFGADRRIERRIAEREGAGITRRESYSPAIGREAIPMSPFGLLRRMMEDMDQLLTGFGGRGLAARSGVLD
ncbi:MAG: hypothetical protein EOP61_20120, partial [Sphingomonadales bacterium]